MIYASDQKITILKFVNDYKKDLSKLKVKAFYGFHLCQNRCIKDINVDNEVCFKTCEEDLSRFFKLKNDSTPQDLNQVYVGPSLIIPEKRDEYIQKCKATKQKIATFMKDMNTVMDETIARYEAS